MKRAGWFTRWSVALALIGIALPQLAAAGVPDRRGLEQQVSPPAERPTPAPANAPAVVDVALSAGGVLQGQVVDVQGVPQAEAKVVVRQNERIVATSVADRDGRFVVSGLGGGIYLISAGSGASVYRLWAPRTAPPVARSTALVVSGQQPVVRGQFQGGGLRYWLTNPYVLALLIGAAIVIPVTMTNRDKESTS